MTIFSPHLINQLCFSPFVYQDTVINFVNLGNSSEENFTNADWHIIAQPDGLLGKNADCVDHRVIKINTQFA